MITPQSPLIPFKTTAKEGLGEVELACSCSSPSVVDNGTSQSMSVTEGAFYSFAVIVDFPDLPLLPL